ncbi:MAG: alkaline phosphatase family protein [Gemmatimonadaceae bacterium]
MLPTPPIRRVVLVVLDGLRPDAIPRFDLVHTAALARQGASTMLGRTVSPSVTACAMASLLTGASPERHGLQGDRFHIPRASGPLHPLPRVLAEHGLPSTAFLARLPMMFFPIGHRIAAHVGTKARFAGRGAQDIVTVAEPTLRTQRQGLILLHFPDADRIGHQRGWMSDAYAAAARDMDAALGRVVAEVRTDDPSTLIIALADHGGGGARHDHHNSAHPLDRTIPVILAGGAVRRDALPAGTSLLDVPPTVLAALGVPQPESYPGVALTTALGLPSRVAA